jgi:hypothetical protein
MMKKYAAYFAAAKPHPEISPGNISFLDCIPPGGTRLATGLATKTKVYGPQSELNHVSGSKKRTLYFYFGMPKQRIVKSSIADRQLTMCLPLSPKGRLRSMTHFETNSSLK